MNNRKYPLRTCVITKEKLLKSDLIRIVRDKDGNVYIDETGKANGRGAYLKRDLVIIEKAQKSKVLDKHLEIEIPDSIFLDLKNIL